MQLFKKLWARRKKEIRAVLGVLDELNCTFDSAAFRIVRKDVEALILAHPDSVVSMVQKGGSPRVFVCCWIANRTGDHVESGEYHLHRGWLRPGGTGEDLLRLYDAMADELVRLGYIDRDIAKERKAGVREGIRTIG